MNLYFLCELHHLYVSVFAIFAVTYIRPYRSKSFSRIALLFKIKWQIGIELRILHLFEQRFPSDSADL